jgi:crotonobetaine/carnitine-CoA ligase
MVVIACANGVAFDPVALTEALRRRMPHFMVPRFVRTIPELPKTPTQKIQKHVLKEQGVTDDTWDREAAGIIVKREAIC